MHTPIEKIMEIAHVSRATAYRALSGSRSVSEETRRRVAEAAEVLDEPVLRRRRASRLALWLSGVGSLVRSPDQGVLIRALEEAVGRRKVSFEVIGEPIPEDPEECVGILRRHRAGGVILLSFFSQRHRQAVAGHCPVVLLFERGDRERITDILPDDFAAGYLATRHLIEHGHRRIVAAVGAGRRPVGFSQRFAGGYVRACAEAGLPVKEELILKDAANLVATGPEDGLPPAAEDFLRLKPRPTAVIGRRLTVTAVMHRLVREGLSVPEGVSVVAYGPGGWDLLGPPGLTQVQYDAREMAEAALDALAGPASAQGSLTIPVALERGSSVRNLKR